MCDDAQGMLRSQRNDTPDGPWCDLVLLTDEDGEQILVLLTDEDDEQILVRCRLTAPDGCPNLHAAARSRRGKAAARAKLPLNRVS